jgi:hypothetical protein
MLLRMTADARRDLVVASGARGACCAGACASPGACGRTGMPAALMSTVPRLARPWMWADGRPSCKHQVGDEPTSSDHVVLDKCFLQILPDRNPYISKPTLLPECV